MNVSYLFKKRQNTKEKKAKREIAYRKYVHNQMNCDVRTSLEAGKLLRLYTNKHSLNIIIIIIIIIIINIQLFY